MTEHQIRQLGLDSFISPQLNEEHRKSCINLIKLYGKEALQGIRGLYIPKDYDQSVGRSVVTAFLAGIEDKIRVDRGLNPRWEGIFDLK